jgi:DNA-binding response OmpR family regulator
LNNPSVPETAPNDVNELAEHPLASLLIVEDEPQQVRAYSKGLKDYQLAFVPNGSAALTWLATNVPDVILLDHVLADGERGLDFLRRLKEAAAHVPVIMISGTLDIQGKLQALQGPHSAHYVLEKPVSLRELRSTIEVAVTECGMGETVRVLQSLERAEKFNADGSERRYTRRLARQHELLKRLRHATDRPNISELAREFEVGRKTVIRDLQDLIRRGQLDPKVYPEWRTEDEEGATSASLSPQREEG